MHKRISVSISLPSICDLVTEDQEENPGLALSSDALQLLLRDPEVFSNQKDYIIILLASPWVFPETPPGGT